MATVEAVYLGTRDAMIAEAAAWNPLRIGVKSRECKYLVMPVGDADWDTCWFSSKAQALQAAKEIAKYYDMKSATRVKVVFV